jgi:hypothetical protein
MIITPRKILTSLGLVASLTVLSACEPGTTSASASLYYDSVMWNDYYYGRPPTGARPPRPPRPEHPIARPPRPEHPIARPPQVRPPIHRPPAARPTPRLR